MRTKVTGDVTCVIEKPEVVECEFATFRHGYVQAHVNLINRVFCWRESNQWNNDFIRTVSQEKVEETLRILRQFPYRPEISCNQADSAVSEKNPHFWRVVIRSGDKANVYVGNDTADQFLKKIIAVLEGISGLTLYW